LQHPFSKFISIKSVLPKGFFEKCRKQEEIGNHKELLMIENGFYKNLYHKQFAVLV
jgi:hypothetical protein